MKPVARSGEFNDMAKSLISGHQIDEKVLNGSLIFFKQFS